MTSPADTSEGLVQRAKIVAGMLAMGEPMKFGEDARLISDLVALAESLEARCREMAQMPTDEEIQDCVDTIDIRGWGLGARNEREIVRRALQQFVAIRANLKPAIA